MFAVASASSWIIGDRGFVDKDIPVVEFIVGNTVKDCVNNCPQMCFMWGLKHSL